MGWSALAGGAAHDQLSGETRDVPLESKQCQLTAQYQVVIEDLALAHSPTPEQRRVIVDRLSSIIGAGAALLKSIKATVLYREVDTIVFFATKLRAEQLLHFELAPTDLQDLCHTCFDNLERMGRLGYSDVVMVSVACKIAKRLGDDWTSAQLARSYRELLAPLHFVPKALSDCKTFPMPAPGLPSPVTKSNMCLAALVKLLARHIRGNGALDLQSIAALFASSQYRNCSSKSDESDPELSMFDRMTRSKKSENGCMEDSTRDKRPPFPCRDQVEDLIFSICESDCFDSTMSHLALVVSEDVSGLLASDALIDASEPSPLAPQNDEFALQLDAILGANYCIPACAAGALELVMSVLTGIDSVFSVLLCCPEYLHHQSRATVEQLSDALLCCWSVAGQELAEVRMTDSLETLLMELAVDKVRTPNCASPRVLCCAMDAMSAVLRSWMRAAVPNELTPQVMRRMWVASILAELDIESRELAMCQVWLNRMWPWVERFPLACTIHLPHVHPDWAQVDVRVLLLKRNLSNRRPDEGESDDLHIPQSMLQLFTSMSFLPQEEEALMQCVGDSAIMEVLAAPQQGAGLAQTEAWLGLFELVIAWLLQYQSESALPILCMVGALLDLCTARLAQPGAAVNDWIAHFIGVLCCLCDRHGLLRASLFARIQKALSAIALNGCCAPLRLLVNFSMQRLMRPIHCTLQADQDMMRMELVVSVVAVLDEAGLWHLPEETVLGVLSACPHLVSWGGDSQNEKCALLFIFELLVPSAAISVEDVVRFCGILHARLLETRQYTKVIAERLLRRMSTVFPTVPALPTASQRIALDLIGDLCRMLYRCPARSGRDEAVPDLVAPCADAADGAVTLFMCKYILSLKDCGLYPVKDVRELLAWVSDMPTVQAELQRRDPVRRALFALLNAPDVHSPECLAFLSSCDAVGDALPVEVLGVFSAMSGAGTKRTASTADSDDAFPDLPLFSVLNDVDREVFSAQSVEATTVAIRDILMRPRYLSGWLVLLFKAAAAAMSMSDLLHDKILYPRALPLLERVGRAVSLTSDFVPQGWPLERACLVTCVEPWVRAATDCLLESAPDSWFADCFVDHAVLVESKGAAQRLAVVRDVLMLHRLKELLGQVFINIYRVIALDDGLRDKDDLKWQRVVEVRLIFLQVTARDLEVDSERADTMLGVVLALGQLDPTLRSDSFALMNFADSLTSSSQTLHLAVDVCNELWLRYCNAKLPKAERTEILFSLSCARWRIAHALLLRPDRAVVAALEDGRSVLRLRARDLSTCSAEKEAALLWEVVVDSALGLQECRRRDPYHHAALFLLSDMALCLADLQVAAPPLPPFCAELALLSFKDLGAVHSLQLLRGLFDRKRPQIAAMWVKDNPIDPWDQVVARIAVFDDMRRRYIARYALLLERCGDLDGSYQLVGYCLECRHCNATVALAVNQSVQVFGRLAVQRLRGTGAMAGFDDALQVLERMQDVLKGLRRRRLTHVAMLLQQSLREPLNDYVTRIGGDVAARLHRDETVAGQLDTVVAALKESGAKRAAEEPAECESLPKQCKVDVDLAYLRGEGEWENRGGLQEKEKEEEVTWL